MTVVLHLVGVFIIGLALGLFVSKYSKQEGFEDMDPCNQCGRPTPCGCPSTRGGSSNPANCKQPDMNKYVLKSSIPPCPAVPDLSNYILKSECPPVPDLSNYVLKSSIPKQNPVLLDCSKCQKAKGECPPCPRARCPEVKCPTPTKCPDCAPCPRTKCPPAIVKCKAEESVYDSPIRPYMTPLNYRGFGMA
jgi:hypothetical protein